MRNVLLVIKSKSMENLGVMYLSAVIKQNGGKCKITTIDRAYSTALELKPDTIGFSIMTGDQERFRMLSELLRKNLLYKFTLIVGGPHPTFFPEDCSWADIIIPGEAENWMYDYSSRSVSPLYCRYNNINEIPWPDRTDFPDMQIRDFIASRGCPNKCLSGDTIIHTIEGDIPIKKLVGKQNVKVLSINPITQEPLYADAINIRKTQEMAELVRVHFDDGSYIDCTPDHKFKVFRYKNQYNLQEQEYDIEAKDLKPKQQIRAVCFSKREDGRRAVSTRRNINIFNAILVMEANLGRKLTIDERVHHQDKDPSNDHYYNLALTTKNRHISDWHPEVSERMKSNNPVRNIPREVLSEHAKKTFRGRKQSIEERIKRRNMQLGENNSNYKPWVKHQNKGISRIKEIDINHKVLKIEQLPYREDVYCMEIPNIHWFYANKVLVHNCTYCYNDRWNKETGTKKIRYRSPEDVVKEVVSVSPQFAYFQDSCFGTNIKWLQKFSREYSYHCRIPFHCHLTPDQVTKERVVLLSDARCYSVRIALESASPQLRKLLNRERITIEDTYGAAKLLRGWKIRLMIQNMLGLPDSTIEDDLETLRINISCRPAYAWCSIFQPYPGTKLADYCIKHKIYDGDFSEISDNFFDHTVLNFQPWHKEQIECLQKVFALCVDKEYVPKPEELTRKNLPKLVHDIMRRDGDSRLYL